MRVRVASAVAALALAVTVQANAQAPSAEEIEKGKAVFKGAGLCYACHGANGEGAVGPKLIEREGAGFWHSNGSWDGIATFIAAGVTKEQSKSGIMMPAKGGAKLSDADVKAVAAYVYSISRKKA